MSVRGSRHAIVIGGGLGGLASGLRLRAAGWRVTVCEAGATFGGKMNVWRQGGYCFDTGPSLITLPDVFHETFLAAGGSLDDYISLERIDPLCQYRYPDGTVFESTASLPAWIETVKRLESRDVNGFLRFLHLGARLWELSRRTFLARTPYNPPTLSDLSVLRHLPLRYGAANYHQTIAAHFVSPYLRQLYDRYPTYVGSTPYRAPSTLALIPYMELAFGGYHVRGGLYQIVEGLVDLCERKGVELRANAPVIRISRVGRRVNGVELEDGSAIAADAVVMNGDASCTAQLLGLRPEPPRERSMSGFVMLFGLPKAIDVHRHTVCFSSDYQQEFAQICSERRFPEDPTVYVNAQVQPDGKQTLFVMANAPATDENWNHSAICRARRRVLARLRANGFPDFEQQVEVADVWTPRRFAERYRMPGGAIYGAASNSLRNAFLRPANRSPLADGLYHVGGSTHPGGGTPTVLLSAKITCGLIARDFQ